MAFRDLQHQLGKLTSDVKTHIAKNNPLQNEETKNISMWIFQERNILAETKTLTYEHGEANKMMKAWTKEEGQDVEDIGDKLFQLLNKQAQIEQDFAAKYQKYRHALKSIRERESSMTEVREKKKALQARIAALQKSSPRAGKLKEFQHELTSLVNDTRDQEAELADFKRFALREAFYLRFNAMAEYAEKTSLLAGFGKYIVDLIDIEPTASGEDRKPYTDGPQSAMILADALNAVNNWKPSHQDYRSTLAEGEGQVREDEIPPTESTANNDKSNELAEASVTQGEPQEEPKAEPQDEPKQKSKGEGIPSVVAKAETETDNGTVVAEQPSPIPASVDQIVQHDDVPTTSSLENAQKPSSDTAIQQPKNSTELPSPAVVAPPTQSPVPAPTPEPASEPAPAPVPVPAPALSPVLVPAKLNDMLQSSTGSHTIMQGSNKEEIAENAAVPAVAAEIVQSPWQHHMVPPQPSPRPHHLTAYGTIEEGLPNYANSNYGQLYRRVSHLRQKQRPYEEFQQQVVRPRVGAGGFRIPVADDTLPPYEPGSQQKQYTDEKRG